MISDLSPGDKLSLKGKLFELQKKLKIIDFENKRKEEYSFSPQLFEYGPMPERDKNVLNNISKAEIIRKQRQELLKASVLMQSSEGCTFSPHITKKSQLQAAKDSRPAHERLTAKGKIYKQNLEKRKTELSKVDFDGDRLFVPHINKSMGSSQSIGPVNSVTADEFLYQDAKDREERQRMRNLDLAEESKITASRTKMNETSNMLLRKKSERELRLLFSYLDREDKGEIGYDELHKASELLVRAEKLRRDDAFQTTEFMWGIFDYNKVGVVSISDYLSIGVPLLYHSTMPATVQEIASSLKLKDSSHFLANYDISVNRKLFAKKTEDLVKLKSLLSQLTEQVAIELHKDKATEQAPVAEQKLQEQPKVNKISHKLALRKEKKDLERIQQLALEEKQRQERELSAAKDESSVAEILAPAASSESISQQAAQLQAVLEGEESSRHDHYHKVLSMRDVLAKQNLQAIKDKVAQERLKECSFQPKVTRRKRRTDEQSGLSISGIDGSTRLDSSREMGMNETGDDKLDLSSTNNDAKSLHTMETGAASSIHDRLYSLSQQKKVPSSAGDQHFISEMQACTFAPKLIPYKGTASPAVNAKDITGFDKSISRIRGVYQEKQRKKEKEEKEPEVNDQRYWKSRELAKLGPVPFKFNLEERRRSQHHQDIIKPSRLVIDVKLSATKTVKIPIADFDHPSELAAKFAKIYGLDKNTQQVLTTVIHQSMSTNNIPVSTDHRAPLLSQRSDSMRTEDLAMELLEGPAAESTEHDAALQDSSQLEAGNYTDSTGDHELDEEDDLEDDSDVEEVVPSSFYQNRRRPPTPPRGKNGDLSDNDEQILHKYRAISNA